LKLSGKFSLIVVLSMNRGIAILLTPMLQERKVGLNGNDEKRESEGQGHNNTTAEDIIIG
jgi:hypothetical protein